MPGLCAGNAAADPRRGVPIISSTFIVARGAIAAACGAARGSSCCKTAESTDAREGIEASRCAAEKVDAKRGMTSWTLLEGLKYIFFQLPP